MKIFKRISRTNMTILVIGVITGGILFAVLVHSVTHQDMNAVIADYARIIQEHEGYSKEIEDLKKRVAATERKLARLDREMKDSRPVD